MQENLFVTIGTVARERFSIVFDFFLAANPKVDHCGLLHQTAARHSRNQSCLTQRRKRQITKSQEPRAKKLFQNPNVGTLK
jgi:hypothetical protein